MKIGDFLSAEYLLDSIVIISHVLGKDKAWVLSHLDSSISPTEAEIIRKMLERRKAGVPLAYVVGRKEFMGFEFEIWEGVFIPRPETERLVEVAVDLMEREGIGEAVEVGCGSGAVSISISKLTGCKMACSDVSGRAVELTKRNARRLGVEDLVDARLGSFLEPFSDILDDLKLVVSNPPYVERSYNLPKEVSYEPEEALFFGEDSIDFYAEFSRLYKGAGFWVVMEFSGKDKDKKLLKEFFRDVVFVKDLDGVERFFIGRA